MTFVEKIREDLNNGVKHNKRSVEKLAASFGIENKILVKELTELAIVLNARDIAHGPGTLHERFTEIVNLYHNQVNLSMRSSHSIMLQQYSTPAPISFLASSYVKSNNPNAMYFEPSAGNGLLTTALPYAQTWVNELDETRYENLKKQPFAKVTRQDATKMFDLYLEKFDGVVSNPPFGTLLQAVEYEGFAIKTLDHAMCINALACMKDDGKAALIIGAHTQWDAKGRVQAGKNRIFLNYLYHHYHVEDIILVDGKKLYSRQGTAFNTRLILINGRKAKPEGAAPLKSSLLSEIVTDYGRFFERVGLDDGDKAKRLKVAQVKAKALRLKMELLSSLDGLNNFSDGAMIVDKNKKPLVVYHGTTQIFSQFKHTNDGGFHFGNKEQAKDRGSILMQAHLHIKNPMLTHDKMDGQRRTIKEAKKKGYDGLVYKNIFEGDGGYSFVAFYPEQIKIIDNGLAGAKQNSKDVMQWAEQHLVGKSIYQKDIGKNVIFTKRAIKHLIYYQKNYIKTTLIYDAIELLKRAKRVAVENDKDNRKQIKAVHILKTDWKYKNTDYKVTIVVREGENGHVYYDHSAIRKEKS